MKKIIGFLSLILIVLLHTSHLKASTIYPLEIFTDNGGYCESSDLNLYFEITERVSTVDFSFHNESLVDSCIARIYFEQNCLLDFDQSSIVEGPGTSFIIPAIPCDLPAGQTLNPPFKRTCGFSIVTDSPRAHDGVNPGEWVMATFDLINGASAADIANALNSGDFRIGAHIIALPDGSSESGVNIPEPSTVLLLGLGALTLHRRRSK